MIPHTVNASRQGLMVRLSYYNSGAVNVNTTLLLNDDGAEGTREGQKLAAVISRDQQEWHSTAAQSMSTAHLDFLMSLNDLESHGGSVYIESLDIVISLKSYDTTPFHPASLHGMREGLMSRTLESQAGLNYRIEIFDQDNVFGDRFVNIGGEVFLVPTNRSGTRRNGVYIFGNNPVLTKEHAQRDRCKFVPLCEADEKLRLYHSHNEALTLGNPSDIYKRELEAQQAQLKSEEIRIKAWSLERQSELDGFKREFERERELAKMAQTQEDRRLQERRAELDRLKHHMDLEGLYRKEGYEVRTANRREWTDVVKYIPVILTLAAAGYGAYKKYVEE